MQAPCTVSTYPYLRRPTVWSVEFWKATAERAVFTFAQALLAILIVGATDLLSVPWVSALSTAGLAALLAVLKCIVANGVGSPGPSLANERLTTGPTVYGRHAKPDPPVDAV